MPKRRLIWQTFFSFIIVLILAITAVTIYIAGSMKKLYLAETSDDLKARSIFFREQLGLAGLESSKADSLCKVLGKESATRFTVILPSGKVIGDTDNDPSKMENHSNRPEIAEALSGKVGVSIRYSHTLSESMMYVALSMNKDGNVVGIIRSALPVTAIDRAFGQIYPRIVLGGMLIAVLAGMLSYYLSRRISIPLERMRNVASGFSRGEFSHRLPPGNSVEIDELSKAINSMAAELDEKIKDVTSRRNELGAILTSMAEGVLTFDMNERLTGLNLAASKMLAIDMNSARGHYVQEIIRYVEFQNLVTQILGSHEPMVSEIQTESGEVLRLNGAILRNDKSESLGALVVLNDITKLRHLEKVRRDFVANVSHELRTPITSIKGFVETLQEGAIRNPQDAERFLGIIGKQTDRLNSIIEDLLTLSQIEETESGQIHLEEHDLKKVLSEAAVLCETKAKLKNIAINIDCDETIRARINSQLIEQAIINLLENAIKYSDDGRQVRLSGIRTDSGIAISIQDWGIGIEKKYLPRLFERFYTVDRARSREMGGTGLGLAIVKHIALAHHGDISVESVQGKGSIFTIHLPN